MAQKNNQNQQRQNTPPPPRSAVQARPPIPQKPAIPTQPRQGISMTTKLCLLLAAIAMLVYCNTLHNGYVLDDVMVIKDNFVVPQGMSKIPEILTTLRLKGYANMSNEYRPLSLVMFATECDLSKWLTPDKGPFNPAIHHFFNLLVFAGCVSGLFIFLNKLFDRKKVAVAFIATLLFAVHPIHTEVVANIKSRDELLCFFFAFVSLNMFANYMKSAKISQLIFGTFALFLSFLSKETVITFLAIVPLIFFFYINDDKMRAFFITAGTVVATGIYLAIRARIVHENGDMEFPINFVDNMLVKSPNAMSRLATEIWILGDYIRLLFVPYPLAIDRSYHTIDYKTFANARVIISALVYLGLVAVAVMRLLKNRKDPWAFSILFFMATISLFSNIAIMLASTFAERFLFFCSVGACIAVALAIEKWLIGKENATFEDIKLSKVLAVLVPVILIFSVETFARNRDWVDSYTLYSADAAKMPQNTRLNYYVASELQKKCGLETTDTVKMKQYNDLSLQYLYKSLAIYPLNTDAQAEIGAAYFRAKRYDSAEWHLKYALQLNPQKSNASANLGTLYMTFQKYPEALIYYRLTNQNDPRNVVAQFNGAVCYYQLKKPDSAILGFQHTIELAPDFYNFKSFQFIAIIYKELGKMNEARQYEAQAKQYDPTFHL